MKIAADKKKQSYRMHGYTIVDEFAWLKNRNSEVDKWEQQQNNATKNRCNDFNTSIHTDVRIKKPSYKNIIEAHGKLYASRWGLAGTMDAVILALNFEEREVLLENDSASGNLKVYSVSPNPQNENLLVLSGLYSGESSLCMIIYNNASKTIEKSIDGVYFFRWSPDGQRLYYSVQESIVGNGGNVNRVFCYDFSTGVEQCIYTDNTNAVFILLEVAVDGSLFIHVSIEYNDIQLIYMDTDTFVSKVINPGLHGNFYYAGCIDGAHYVYTTCDTDLGKLVRLSDHMEYQDSETVLQPPEPVFLQGVTIVESTILAFYLDGVFNRIEQYDHNGKSKGAVELPSPYGAIELYPESPLPYNHGSKHLYFSFQSFTIPPTIIRYDVCTGLAEIVYYEIENSVPELVVDIKKIKAEDGTILPAYLVYDPKKRDKNAPMPALMYGYGGFGNVTTPFFTIQELGMAVCDWAQAGGLYVHCIIRGGGEYGQSWHQQGKMLNKKNSFTDFINIAEWLVDNHWSRTDMLAAVGGSNGGLLMSAVMTMRPDLFKAIIACIPVTDMIQFADDPRGPMYINEYGNPASLRDFEYLYTYSPYHHIDENISYPAAYFQTGKYDSNALPYHAEKFIAKLQAASKTDTPYLIKILDSGHDFGVGQQYTECCIEKQQFLFGLLNIEKTAIST